MGETSIVPPRRRAPRGVPGAFVSLLLLSCSPPATPPAKLAPSPASDEVERAPDPAPQQDDAARRDAEGHARMVTALAREARAAIEQAPYVGERRASELRAQLERDDPRMDPLTRTRTRYQLAAAELELGREREAIAQFETAKAELAALGDAVPPGPAAELTYQLGVAYLRLGETQNCCLRSNADSCILPISGGGVHVDEEGARKAMAAFLEVARAQPPASRLHKKAVWLLNVAAMTVAEHPAGVPEELRIPADAFAGDAEVRDFPRFPNVSRELGLDRESLAGGAVVDDFDGDGLLDIIVTDWYPDKPPALWRNKGDGTFENKLEGSGLEGITGGLNLVHADYDNDGDNDLYILRGAWLGALGQQLNSLVRNDGGWRFTDVTFAAGMGETRAPTQTAAWADYDGDGDLDLYVGNESTPALRVPSQLMRNNGDGTFTDVAARAGVRGGAMAKGVTWGDYDDDGDPDLYVSNLGAPNRLYRNNGDGTFTDVAGELGVDAPRSSFPTWFWDFDGDGALDLFVASYEADAADMRDMFLGQAPSARAHALYRGDGRGRLLDVTAAVGLTRPSSVMGSNFGDLDADGLLDFYLGTGAPPFDMLQPNQMYRGAPGPRFVELTFPGGFGHLQKGHGVAFADLDHDGDLDVFEQMGGAFPGDRFGDALYRNPGVAGHHWLSLELVGVTANRSAIGARVRVRVEDAGGERSIHRRVSSGGSFGGNPLRQFIGLGPATRVVAVDIVWPGSGAEQTISDVPVDAPGRVPAGPPALERLERPPFSLAASTPSG